MQEEESDALREIEVRGEPNKRYHKKTLGDAQMEVDVFFIRACMHFLILVTLVFIGLPKKYYNPFFQLVFSILRLQQSITRWKS